MAKLYITRQPNGTYRLRGLRLAGKELAATKVVDGVKHGSLREEVVKIMDEVAPPKIVRQKT